MRLSYHCQHLYRQRCARREVNEGEEAMILEMRMNEHKGLLSDLIWQEEPDSSGPAPPMQKASDGSVCISDACRMPRRASMIWVFYPKRLRLAPS